MTTDNLTPDGANGPDGPVEAHEESSLDAPIAPPATAPRLVGLLALGEFSLHVDLTAALAEVRDPAFALRIAALSAGRLDRARRFTEVAGADTHAGSGVASGVGSGVDSGVDSGVGALEAWRPTVDVLRGIPAADRFEAMVGAAVVGGVLSDLAALLPGSGPESGVTAAGAAGAADDDDLLATVRGEVEADPALAGRLSLYGRRVFGRILLAGRGVVAALAEPERGAVQTYLAGAGEGFADRMSAMGLKG